MQLLDRLKQVNQQLGRFFRRQFSVVKLHVPAQRKVGVVHRQIRCAVLVESIQIRNGEIRAADCAQKVDFRPKVFQGVLHLRR